MKSPQTIWASVVIIFILMASATVLVALDKDVSIILALVGLVVAPVLGVLGVAVYHKVDQVGVNVDQVAVNSNGNLLRVLEMQQKTQDQLTALAMAMPPISAPPATPTSPEEGK